MSKTTNDRGPPKSIAKLIGEVSGRHHQWTVFSDFVEMAAISLSNAVDLRQRDEREARYMEVVKRYERDELEKFPQMMAALIDDLDTEPSDVLGRVFHELELHNKWTGQFFTPFPVCEMMAKMTLADDHRAMIGERGFIRASEPACGSGAMVIALAKTMLAEKINYQQHLHVTAVDVDLKCVHMAYLQFSLLHIPAVIVHGNTISLEEWSHWYTPAHIMGGWNWKLRRSETTSTSIETPPERPEPEPLAATIAAKQLTLF
jgi:N-6 DNA Methylase